MLIAMMSKTYEDTSENEEIAWKFHRTSVWIRYIRREVVRPPPMNLFPNPWRLKENMWRVRNFCQHCFRGGGNLTNHAYNEQGKRIPRRGNRSITSRLCCGTFGSEESLKSPMVETDNNFTESTVELSMLKSTPMSNSMPSKPRQSHNTRFNPAVVSGVKAALRMNVGQQHSKAVLNKLVFRYKIKHLTKK